MHESDAFPAPPDRVGFRERCVEFVLFRFRWMFVLGLILPLSLLFEAYSRTRNWIVVRFRFASRSHARKVARIQKQIRDWIASGRTRKLCTGRPGGSTMCFRYPKYKNTLLGVQTNTLGDILELDTHALTVRCEPMVTMGDLTRYLIPRGYTLPIVPELDDLTVGGLINGCGIESSGRKYGLFQHTCVSYELVMPDGELIVVTKASTGPHQSLFYGIPWSHGSLGFLVAATIKIIPVKKFVRLAYYPCESLMDLSKTLRRESLDAGNEFVEAIQFTFSSGVVMSGQFADSVPKNGRLNSIGRWYKPWFFKHVEGFLRRGKSSGVVVEHIPIREYYHRHSRSIFWEIRDLVSFGNHPLFRWIFGWAMPPKIALLKMTMPAAVKNLYDRHHVIQDLLIPLDNLSEGIRLLDAQVQIYPLWLCPFSLPSQPGLVRNRHGKNTLYVDIGIYGNCTLPEYHPVKTIRKLEAYVRSVHGIQLLYADCYQTCAEFWEMFDASLYDWLRAKYQCKEALPSVFEKVSRLSRS